MRRKRRRQIAPPRSPARRDYHESRNDERGLITRLRLAGKGNAMTPRTICRFALAAGVVTGGAAGRGLRLVRLYSVEPRRGLRRQHHRLLTRRRSEPRDQPADPAVAGRPQGRLQGGRHHEEGRLLPAQLHHRRAQRHAHERAQQLRQRQHAGDHQLPARAARRASRRHRRPRPVRRRRRLPAHPAGRARLGGQERHDRARLVRHHVHRLAGQVERPEGVHQPGRQGQPALSRASPARRASGW